MVDGSCHARPHPGGLYVLPDPRCTPGAIDPAVTRANIDSTICTHGWTETIRPPESYTEPLKYKDIALYGEPPGVWNYEEDHLIPLELGGSPTSQANLWPEPGESPNPKDAVENAANAAVCNGQISLNFARREIATNWIAFGNYLKVDLPANRWNYQAPAAPTTTTTTMVPPPPPPPWEAARCSVSAVNAGNPYYPEDYDVTVTSNQPNAPAHSWDASGQASGSTGPNGTSTNMVLYYTHPGEEIHATAGHASCSGAAS